MVTDKAVGNLSLKAVNTAGTCVDFWLSFNSKMHFYLMKWFYFKLILNATVGYTKMSL